MTMAVEAKSTQLRIPADMYEQIKELAEKELRSANAQIVQLLKEALEARERKA